MTKALTVMTATTRTQSFLLAYNKNTRKKKRKSFPSKSKIKEVNFLGLATLKQ
jgi:hypothetical protein